MQVFRKVVLPLGFLIAFLLIGVSMLLMVLKPGNGTEADQLTPTGVPGGVTEAAVTVGDIDATISLEGTVNVDPATPVKASTDGVVNHIYVGEGSRVEQGAPIYQIRYEKSAPAASGAASAAAAGGDGAAVQLTAPANPEPSYAYADVVAPVAGVLNKYTVSLGDTVTKGTAVTAIASSTYRVSANVEPIKLYQLDPLPTVAKVIINQGPEPFECVNLRLKEGGDAATPPPANPQPQPPISPESGFAGAPLAEAAPPVSGSGSQLNCVVPDGIKVFNGLAAKLEISLGRAEGVLTVPRTAVQGQGANGSVWVYDDKGEPVETKVVLGLSDGNLIEVKEGLKEGQAILEYVPGTEPAPAEDELYGGVGVSGYGG